MTNKTGRKGKKRDHIASKVAELTGYSYDMVRRTRNGEVHNETIMTVLMEVTESDNKLKEHIKNIVPIDLNSRENRHKRTLKYAKNTPLEPIKNG